MWVMFLQSEVKNMFCRKCGTRIADGASFCHVCGAKVVREDAGTQDTYNRQYVNRDPSETRGTESGKTKQSNFEIWWDSLPKAVKILIVLVAVLAVGFIIKEFGEFLLFAVFIGAVIFALITGSKEEKSAARSLLLDLAVGMVVIIGIAVFLVNNPDFVSNIFRPGANVRDSYLTRYSENVTIEDAFENFFENEKWSTYNEDGYSYVAFTGSCEFMGKTADVKIAFKVTGEHFVVDSLDLNGIRQSDLVLYGLLSKVYEGY